MEMYIKVKVVTLCIKLQVSRWR